MAFKNFPVKLLQSFTAQYTCSANNLSTVDGMLQISCLTVFTPYAKLIYQTQTVGTSDSL